MIEAEAAPPASALAARLARKAEALAKARADNAAPRRDPWRWRRAALLWPLFGKD